MMTRRQFAALSGAFALQACGSPATSPRSVAVTRDPTLQPIANPAFDAWIAGFRGRAARAGIRESTLNTGLRGVGFLPGVVKRDRNQTEFKRSFDDYLLAFDGRRGAFFEKQLIAALKILQTGDTTPAKLVGSWAGAMGHTQFIPTSHIGRVAAGPRRATV